MANYQQGSAPYNNFYPPYPPPYSSRPPGRRGIQNQTRRAQEKTLLIRLMFHQVLSRAWEPESGVFGSFEPEPVEKKIGAGAAWKKSQEPEPLKN